MSELEKSRLRVRQGGKLLYKVCVISKTVLTVLIVAQAILTVAVLYSPQASVFIGDRLNNNFLFKILVTFAGLQSMEPKYQAAIGCTVIFISYVVIFAILKMFAGIMKFLAEGERPFDVQTARHIRHNSFWLLLFFVYNPLLGITSFSITLLFSYIMEYGAYIQERADETNRIQEEIIMSFAEITENKSGQTGQHIKRVSEYSRVLAKQLGLAEDKVELIRIASTMHDVGKLMIPPEILEKPGKLTDEEYAIIKTHTTMGGQLLYNVEGEEMKESRTIAMQHHERYDGKGHPTGLAGEDISLEGRIVAVADVYDALTSRRSYKNAWSEKDAYDEIIKGRGSQFDPKVVDAFAAAHDKILEVRDKYKD